MGENKYSKHNAIINLVAFALKYDATLNKVPVMTASGKDNIAEQMLKVARQNGVPIECNPELASMLALLDIGDYIPVEAFVAVAEIMAFIYRKDKF